MVVWHSLAGAYGKSPEFSRRRTSSENSVKAKFVEITLRDRPKSPQGGPGVALRNAEKTLFDPFGLPHSGRIHPRSVAQTPFRTVSEGVFSEVRMQNRA